MLGRVTLGLFVLALGASGLVAADPVITQQPHSRVVNPGTNLYTIGNPAFSVNAETAAPPLQYAWYREDADGDILVAGPGDEHYLLLTNIQEEHEGSYYARVTNSAVPPVTVESQHATLEVRDPPVFVEHPEDLTTFADREGYILLYARAESEITSRVTYDWQWQPLDGSAPFRTLTEEDYTGRLLYYILPWDKRQLSIYPVCVDDSGFYRARATAPGVGSVFSNVATVIVEVPQRCDLNQQHAADVDRRGNIDLDELLRVIQLFNAGSYSCDMTTADWYAPGGTEQRCCPHDADYRGGADWSIDLLELLRVIQFFNMGGYGYSVHTPTEDGFRPIPR